MTQPHNDFDVAKSIHDLLEPLNAEHRQRILRWVSETLGIANTVVLPPTLNPMAAIPTISTPDATHAISHPSHAPNLHLPTDIKTFVDSKSPKSDQQFATVVAYYYRFMAPEQQRQNSLTTETLQDATRLVGRSRLTNPNATLNNAKKAGYLNSSTPGAFEISTVGENLVAMTLPSRSESKPKKSGARKKGTKKSTASTKREPKRTK